MNVEFLKNVIINQKGKRRKLAEPLTEVKITLRVSD